MKKTNRLVHRVYVHLDFQKSMGKWHGHLIEEGKAKEYAIKVASDLTQLKKIGVLYHEFTHLIFELLATLDISVKLHNNSENIKRIITRKYNPRDEERVCRHAEDACVEIFKKYFKGDKI